MTIPLPRVWLVELLPMSHVFPAREGATILDSAAQSGIALPSSCRNGTCRACLCRLKSGRVHYRVEWPSISSEEKQEGWILPCVAEPLAALRIEQGAARQIDVPEEGAAMAALRASRGF